jgi:hypothetical protein
MLGGTCSIDPASDATDEGIMASGLFRVGDKVAAKICPRGGLRNGEGENRIPLRDIVLEACAILREEQPDRVQVYPDDPAFTLPPHEIVWQRYSHRVWHGYWLATVAAIEGSTLFVELDIDDPVPPRQRSRYPVPISKYRFNAEHVREPGIYEAGRITITDGRLYFCDPCYIHNDSDVGEQGVWVTHLPNGEWPVYVELMAGSGGSVRAGRMWVDFLPDEPDVEWTPSLDNADNAEVHGRVCVDGGAVAVLPSQGYSRWLPFLPDDKGELECMSGCHTYAASQWTIMDEFGPVCDGVVAHSGYGDGYYPVVAIYDEQDRTQRIEINFYVYAEDNDEGELDDD